MDGNTRPDGLTYDYGPVSNSSPTFNSNSSPPITGSSNATSSSEPGPADQNTASNGLDGRPKEPTVPAACLGCVSYPNVFSPISLLILPVLFEERINTVS